MKKLFVAVAALLVCLSVNAQKIGIEAGYNHTWGSTKVAGSDKWVKSDNPLNGAFLGLQVIVPSEGIVGLKTGLDFNYGTCKDASLLGATSRFTKMDLVLPVDVILNCNFSNSFAGFLYAGVTGNLTASLTETVTTVAASSSKHTYNLFEDSYYNRCYLGMNVGLGVEIANHYKVFGEYGHSLTNLINKDSVVNNVVEKAKYGYFNVGVAYMF